jgi:cytochrome c peroxidase
VKLLLDTKLGFTKRTRYLICAAIICAGIAALTLHFWARRVDQLSQANFLSAETSHDTVRPIEPPRGLNIRKIALGRKLFHDPWLYHNDEISCARRHHLRTGGAGGRPRSIGINGAVGAVNAPTVFNSGFNFSQFWDGRGRHA